MPLIPKIVVVSQTATTITVKDDTGIYHVTDNPGGYGAPNLASPPDRLILQAEYLGGGGSIADKELLGADLTAYLAAGYTWDFVFKDGVYKITAQVIYESLVDLTTTEDSKEFLLADADELLAGASGIIITEIDVDQIWLLNQTVDLSATGGELILVATEDSTGPFSIVFKAEAYAVSYVAGEGCLLSDIGIYAESRAKCDWETERELLRRVLMNISIGVKFEKKDYAATHNLAVRLYNYCDCATAENCECS